MSLLVVKDNSEHVAHGSLPIPLPLVLLEIRIDLVLDEEHRSLIALAFLKEHLEVRFSCTFTVVSPSQPLCADSLPIRLDNGSFLSLLEAARDPELIEPISKAVPSTDAGRRHA